MFSMCPMSLTIAELDVEIVCASELMDVAVTEHGQQHAAGDRGEESAGGQDRADDDRRGAPLGLAGTGAAGNGGCGCVVVVVGGGHGVLQNGEM